MGVKSEWLPPITWRKHTQKHPLSSIGHGDYALLHSFVLSSDEC